MHKWFQMEDEEVDIEEQAFRELQGKYKHFCMDWDGMAIDETCPEFESCRCFKLAEEEQQTISFAYGNTKLSNPNITKDLVEEEFRKWKNEAKKPIQG